MWVRSSLIFPQDVFFVYYFFVVALFDCLLAQGSHPWPKRPFTFTSDALLLADRVLNSVVNWKLPFGGISINWQLTSWMVEHPAAPLFLWVSSPETPMDKNCFAFLFPQQIYFSTAEEILNIQKLCVNGGTDLGGVDSAPPPLCWGDGSLWNFNCTLCRVDDPVPQHHGITVDLGPIWTWKIPPCLWSTFKSADCWDEYYCPHIWPFWDFISFLSSWMKGILRIWCSVLIIAQLQKAAVASFHPTFWRCWCGIYAWYWCHLSSFENGKDIWPFSYFQKMV